MLPSKGTCFQLSTALLWLGLAFLCFLLQEEKKDFLNFQQKAFSELQE